MGENGAGKSTLMKILYGEQRPDEGAIIVRGEEQTSSRRVTRSPSGIGMVHQHFMLADNLTVAENVILGDGAGLAGAGSTSVQASDRITELGEIYGLDGRARRARRPTSASATASGSRS